MTKYPVRLNTDLTMLLLVRAHFLKHLIVVAGLLVEALLRDPVKGGRGLWGKVLAAGTLLGTSVGTKTVGALRSETVRALGTKAV